MWCLPRGVGLGSTIAARPRRNNGCGRDPAFRSIQSRISRKTRQAFKEFTGIAGTTLDDQGKQDEAQAKSGTENWQSCSRKRRPRAKESSSGIARRRLWSREPRYVDLG